MKIYLLIIAFVTSLFHVYFDNDYSRYDVFLFSDVTNYLQNIVRDVCLLTGWLLACYYAKLTTKKRTLEGIIARSLFIYSILNLSHYFLIYENATEIKIALTLLLIMLLYRKSVVEEICNKLWEKKRKENWKQ